MRGIKAAIRGLALGLVLASTNAYADEASLSLEAGKQQAYSYSQVVKRVAVGDPAVAAVSVMTAHRVLITAKQPGSTQISIWENDQAQPSQVIQLNVGTAPESAQQRLDAVHVQPLQAVSAGKGLALTGWVSSLESHALAEQAMNPEKALPLDASVSSFDSQVQIDIKVVEVSRQNMMRAGLFFGRNKGNKTFAVGAPGTLSGVETGGSGFNLTSGSGFLPISNAFNLVLGNAGSGLLGTISVLEANGFAYTLAEPSLTAISGQSATFLAGGEYPVPLRSGGGSDSSITIQYKEYGIRLMLTPTVLDANRIYLKVSPEVSELDFANAVQTGGVSVPGLRVRRTDTSVALGDGESFVISGLVSRSTLNNVDKFPWLGDLPVIGAFFRSTRFDREDKELLMVVTPHLVRPLARDAQTPALPGDELRDYQPSFSELFFQKAAVPGQPSTGMSQ